MTEVRVGAALLVVYTQRLDECLAFYSDLGLPLVQEQHSNGPVHYAAELAGGLVVELYPGKPERTTGWLRLGFTVPATAERSAGRHQVTDPDGRVVELHAVEACGDDARRRRLDRFVAPPESMRFVEPGEDLGEPLYDPEVEYQRQYGVGDGLTR